MAELFTVKEASKWATEYLKKNVTPSNISYLVNYGRISKAGDNGTTLVAKADLIDYYNQNNQSQEERLRERLGKDLNWTLSFSEYKESETTKHVHRLHPYKGKFIPQLVEYFLDERTDRFKTETFFNSGNVILDPFCGSGTTLVQASELGINAVGVDVSAFNAQISNSKVGRYNLETVEATAKRITKNFKEFVAKKNNLQFEKELLEELKGFNQEFFPSPEFKYKVRQKLIDEKEYGAEKTLKFLPKYEKLVEKYNITLLQDSDSTFLDKWFLQVIRDEVNFLFEEIQNIGDPNVRSILEIIFSRTVRSCRATTHSDLGTLFEPITAPYYCKKHGKICKPLFSMQSWWVRYTKDTIKRIAEFEDLRTKTSQKCLIGDSREINILKELRSSDPELAQIVENQGIDGIFSSPPYVGIIDYHEQHAYSYDLFGYERKDELEIGPLYKGQGKAAKDSYVKGISEVLLNCKKFLNQDYNVFLVSNDKHGLYDKIAELAGMEIVNQFKRPVLNRVEKDRNPYSEIIFHLKEKQ